MDAAQREILAANIKRVRERIAAACARVKRDPKEVTLIAVTKTVGPDVMQTLIELGVTDIGENKLQAAKEKFPLVPSLRDRSKVKRHFIGHLQTNKVKGVLELFDVIHSVDSVKLAQEIEKRAKQIRPERRIPCFLELNLANESTKSGIRLRDEDLVSFDEEPFTWRDHAKLFREQFKPSLFLDRYGREDVATLEEGPFSWRAAATLVKEFFVPALFLDRVGLMVMAPAAEDEDRNRRLFRLAYAICRCLALGVCLPRGVPDFSRGMPFSLSMGMSNDFEIAIEEGATHVRIGTALFEGL